MNATDLAYAPATELIPQIRSKALSPVELMRAVLERIEQVNPKINAFCTVTADAALAAARAAEEAVMKGGPLGPLHGIPVSIKDLALAAGRPHAFGSHIFEQAHRRGRRAVRAPAQGGGRHPDRQDHDAGVRLEGARRQPAHRASRAIRGTWA